MCARIVDNISDAPVPFGLDRAAILKSVQSQVSYDAMMLGVFRLSQPHPDEVVVAHGWSAPDLHQWCQLSSFQTGWMAQAVNTGWAVSSNVTPNGEMTLLVMTPESVTRGRWWCLLLSRNQPFGDADRQSASLLLRQWHAQFANSDEEDAGRLLLAHDNRLIAADPFIELKILQKPQTFDALIQFMHEVIAQRWPAVAVGQTHDFTVLFDERPYWICFEKQNHVNLSSGEQWYLELRKLEANDLPPVGVIEDARIAQALAYIHDHYHESPGLSAIAEAVHISPFHFHRLFTKQAGVSPKQYLQRKQLQVARWLLTRTREPIRSIAKRCGFSSHGHFTSTFHRMLGISPSEYREDRRG